ncbi:MAG: tetratricopeptide repeat protein [Acidobacteria bacterium]|nr:tetratricopeptide repeat protein [Acidobacteriota bacterium]
MWPAKTNTGILLGLLALAAYALTQAPAQTPSTASAYAAPETCAACHRSIWQTYRQTGMGRSFSRPSPANTVGNETANNTFYHKPSDSYFTMLRRDDKYYQRRHQIDPAGRQINVIEKQIDYIMGSGGHARAFLHRTARNTLVELPLAWYAEKGGYWGMNPGYDRPDHEGFRRKISYDCMFCHNGYPKIPSGHDQSFAEPVYLASLPEGIDCQRCHGPGRDHVRLAENGAKLESIRKAIVNPARLSAERREEVCIQCHLETTSFALPNSIQRYGKGPFTYRPGEPLSDYWLFFDHAAGTGHDDKFELVNAVYRIRRSKCFLQSNNTLHCTTCHNPHDVPRGAQATPHYDAACRQCHNSSFDRIVAAGKHTRSAGCAECHMPKRRTEDVVHAVATDHFIQRRKPAGDLLADIAERHESGDKAYRGEVVLYYPEKLPPPDNDLYPAVAQVVEKSNLTDGISRLSDAIERHAPQRAEFYYELAEAWRNSGQLAKALPLYREAVQRNPKSTPGLQKLGSALRRSGQLTEAVDALKRSVAAAPDNASNWHELGLAYRAQGNMPEALAALQKAAALDPDMPELHSNLGIVWSAAGDRTRAEAAFREAIRIQPDYVDAHNNLGNLLSAAGDFNQARHHFEVALKLRPGDATTRYNFAMALGRARQFDEAQQQLEASLRADPEHADARQRLAELLMAKGQTQAALPHYRELVRIQPESGQARLGLGAALAMTGDVAGALPHLQKAASSSDPATREQAAEILRQIGNRR